MKNYILFYYVLIMCYEHTLLDTVTGFTMHQNIFKIFRLFKIFKIAI